ncbi:MAG: hypothetical protein RLZZ269_7, partial [Actinomycetota bacterium]
MAERQVPERRWNHYRATIVTIAHDDEVVEARDLARRLGATIHVITAWKPVVESPLGGSGKRRSLEHARPRFDLPDHLKVVG